MADEKISRKEVRKQLEDLTKLFQKLPKQKFKTLADKVKKDSDTKHQTRKQESLQETIDYLRVCIKYTMLDVDSLRREIKYLRELLKENGKG